MATFAEIDDTKTVVRIIVTDDPVPPNTLPDFILQYFADRTWVQTFEDGSQRANYAGIGFTYDSDNDVFIPPQPAAAPEIGIASYTLDPATYKWTPVDANNQPTSMSAIFAAISASPQMGALNVQS